MRTQLSVPQLARRIIRPLLTATFALAITFTLSCSNPDGDSSDPSSSSGKEISSSSSKETSSSSKNNNSSSSSGGSAQGAFNKDSQIYQNLCDYIEDSEDWIYICESIAYTDNEYVYIEDLYFEDEPLRLGSINNGIVTLQQLPSTVPSENLSPFLDLDEEEAEEYCTEYTPGLELYIPRFMLLDRGEGYTGFSLEIADAYDNEGIMYMYFSKAGKIKCERYEENINMDVKEGWNEIYYKTTKNDEDYYSTREYSTSNILTTEVRWILK